MKKVLLLLILSSVSCIDAADQAAESPPYAPQPPVDNQEVGRRTSQVWTWGKHPDTQAEIAQEIQRFNAQVELEHPEASLVGDESRSINPEFSGIQVPTSQLNLDSKSQANEESESRDSDDDESKNIHSNSSIWSESSDSESDSDADIINTEVSRTTQRKAERMLIPSPRSSLGDPDYSYEEFIPEHSWDEQNPRIASDEKPAYPGPLPPPLTPKNGVSPRRDPVPPSSPKSEGQVPPPGPQNPKPNDPLPKPSRLPLYSAITAASCGVCAIGAQYAGYDIMAIDLSEMLVTAKNRVKKLFKKLD